MKPTAVGSIIELVVIVLIAVGLALGIQALVVKPYRIPSESMEPTLNIGQRVLVNRIGNRFNDPHVGEIVVFHPPKGGTESPPVCGQQPLPAGQLCPKPTNDRSDINFIKRVVAGPGDTIQVIDGHVIRNGVREKDPYIRPCGAGSDCTFSVRLKVPPGHWFMMGDNRGQSDDSRYWGPVPKKWIIGGAFATYWPVDRLGFL